MMACVNHVTNVMVTPYSVRNSKQKGKGYDLGVEPLCLRLSRVPVSPRIPGK